ncbi:MAG: hypothetical protein QOF16_1702 [Actinomycetota bacterium]|nr:hypothetical protein [Actinomycetota bacterium]
MIDDSHRDLIEAADLNGLLRAVDALCERRAWEDLIDLADACEDALERGKQLWPIAAHIDYRLALEAPGDIAASVLDPSASRFSLGPLTEVAASTHTWADLAPYIEAPQSAAYVAQERVLRGEVLTGDERAHPEILELPLELLSWEPAYSLPAFGKDHVEIQEPWDPVVLQAVDASAGELLDDPDAHHALLELVRPWTTESNGAARAVVVSGSPESAAATISDVVRIAEIPAAEALQRMAWAAASGGAHGRRRGGALGRSLAWSATATLYGLEWPITSDEMFDAVHHLRFYLWDEGEAEEGWVLRIAVADTEDGWSAALAATDLVLEE